MAKITLPPWIADDHQIFTSAGDRIAVFGNGTSRTQEERATNQANARLAATAPEMYRVLAIVLKGIRQGPIKDQTILDFSKDNQASIPMVPLSKIIADTLAQAQS